MCEVTVKNSNDPISWLTDLSSIGAEEVYVKVLDKFPVRTHLSHHFVRKTFLSLAFCECCRRLLFSGFYCNQCNFRCHQRCEDKVQPLCHQINMDYQNYLPAKNSSDKYSLHGHGGFLHHSGAGRRPRSLNQQDRSNSAPNVNIVKTLTSEQQKTLAQSSRIVDTMTGIVPQQDFIFQNPEHSQSTQASPTNTMRHVKRQRARSADESNKNLLSPRDQKSSDENWVRIFNLLDRLNPFLINCILFLFTEHPSR